MEKIWNDMNWKTWNRDNILITSWRSYVALELIRILWDQNDVFSADSKNHALSNVSRYTKKSFLLPSPKIDINEYKTRILNIINDNSVSYLIPTCEEIFYISYIKDFIEDNSDCKVFCSDFPLLKKLHSKFEYAHILPLDDRIHVPETRIFMSISEVESFLRDNPAYKYVLKNEFSRFGTNIASNAIPDMPIGNFNSNPDNKLILQEYIQWTQVCTYSVFSHGKLMIHSSYKNNLTHWNWSWISFESYRTDEIIDFLTKFWHQTWFHGQIAFDLIKNDDGIHIIECNPRTTSWVHLFADSEDFRLKFLDSMERWWESDTVLTPSYQDKSFKLILFFTMNEFIFSGKLRPFLSSIFKSEDIVYAKNDRLPFFYQIYDYFCYVREAIAKKKKITDCMTDDIEYNWDKDLPK
ncbi:MAG: hypothetical protein ACD_2C00152G0004 [uncultured bacterium (gcode 4)]|uniref:ATP-grasp domain-containing protein n=1 Tax=uncultured bacterium (gcode 4) TaxID=1234023 RepID=K2H121_9BACT|nr:MAG: hypothetical protein ACD_2C00152G0004 [uncultured bacterium (gcode 4)]